MSNIAGLLSNLMSSLPQPDASARGPSGQSNAATPGKGGASGFDTILSKLGQNGASADAKAFAQFSGTAGNPGGTVKPGAMGTGAHAGTDDTNTIIGNAITSAEAQAPDAVAARAAASKLMSNAAATAASKSAAASAAAARAEKTSADASDVAAGDGGAAKTALSGKASPPGVQAKSTATGAATGQPDAKPAAMTTAQLSASLAAAAASDTSASDTVDTAGPPAAKSQSEDLSGAAANNAAGTFAANAAAVVVADIVAAGQPAGTLSGADKAHAGGKAGRSANTDGTGRTASKPNSSKDKADAPAANAALDPSLQSVVLASAGLGIGASVPAQPSFQAQSDAIAGPADPNLKAIMTASAIAEANSAAKMGTGAEQVDDPDAPTILRVLSTETHFAPAAQLSPVQQIADTVIGALPNPSHPFGASAAETDAGDAGSSSASSASSTSGTPDSTSSAIVGPVKILNLQLEPPSLGTVTINLSLSDGGLNVQLAASQVSTMSLIDKDKDTLSNQLKESGYAVAGVGVTISIDGSNVP
ncbi:MAG TPA: flagellar hook-length control protein FliK, partial [Methylovirgula sp.]|nr:flagellar hook-length control protein FliK [Methylovirgula sp.]